MVKTQTTKSKSLFDAYAIIKTGGKQYQAIAGKTIGIEKLDVAEGNPVTFSEVLLRKNGDSIEVGQPFLKTPVKAVVVKHLRGPKVIVFRFKRRKKYKKRTGHRQPITVVRIESI